LTVITLSRQLGSGGDVVAQEVANRLGLRLVDREIINQAARQAGVPEVALAEIDELGLLGVKPRPAALREYGETASRLIRQLADEGNLLVVGRGGQVVLADYAGALHVRVIAPQSMRLDRIQVKCRVTADVAAALLEASDRARTSYVLRHFQVDPDSCNLYDLILNMAHLTIATATDLICLAAQRCNLPDHEVSA
jgi:cytidylate kinase